MTDAWPSLYRPSSPAQPSLEFARRLRRRLENQLLFTTQPGRLVLTQVTATPHLAVRDAAGAIDFYQRAFDAVEMARMTDPSGKIAYAEIGIGDARIGLKDEDPPYDPSPQSLGGTSVRIVLQVEDVDALVRQALAAGAEVIFPLADQPYGYRAGRLADPFGHQWIVQTPLSDQK